MAKKVVRYKLVRHKWPDEIQAERKKKMRCAGIAALCVLCFFAGFAGHAFLKRDSFSQDKTFSKLSQIYSIMSEQFYFGKDIEDFEDALVMGAINGLVEAGNDPHTMYLDSEQSSDFTSSMEGSFVGIGAQFYEEDADTFIITRVLNDSPAEQAGLQKGDQIYRVQGTICKDMSADDVKELILGESGSEVTLVVIRDGKERQFTMQRATVNDSVYRDIRDDVGILEISSFTETAGEDTGKQLEKLKQAGCQSLILDLRNNGGGYLQPAQQIASYLLPTNTLIFQEKDRDGEVEEYYTLDDHTRYTFEKIILLVNENTASAAEVLTAALKDNLDNVTIVGKNTYGKGTVQIPLPFSDGSMLKYTTAEWMTPGGKAINGVGIQPDIEVSMDSAYATGAPQLEKDEAYEADTVNSAAASVQTYLKFLGYEVDRCDAYFSAKGAQALKQYQKDNGLTADGVIDADVIDQLLTSVAKEWNSHLDRYDLQMKKALELVKAS